MGAHRHGQSGLSFRVQNDQVEYEQERNYGYEVQGANLAILDGNRHIGAFRAVRSERTDSRADTPTDPGAGRAAGTGASHARHPRSGHRPGAPAQSLAAGGAHHDLQNQAQEITANLRPNPVLLGDAQFLPIFQPSNFTSDYLDNSAQFDLGVGYLFERGKKRQHRLQAAKDQTAVTTAQVADNERTLTFNVASQFISALLAQADLELAETDLDSFQQTVDISQASSRPAP